MKRRPPLSCAGRPEETCDPRTWPWLCPASLPPCSPARHPKKSFLKRFRSGSISQARQDHISNSTIKKRSCRSCRLVPARSINPCGRFSRGSCSVSAQTSPGRLSVPCSARWLLCSRTHLPPKLGRVLLLVRAGQRCGTDKRPCGCY